MYKASVNKVREEVMAAMAAAEVAANGTAAGRNARARNLNQKYFTDAETGLAAPIPINVGGKKRGRSGKKKGGGAGGEGGVWGGREGVARSAVGPESRRGSGSAHVQLDHWQLLVVAAGCRLHADCSAYCCCCCLSCR
jgi:hypothetical protein